MEFFLDVGIYALIVALTAAGAGFVAFRLLTGGGLTARRGKHGRTYRGVSESDDGADVDEWAAASVRATQSPAPTANAQSAGKDAPVAVAPPPSPPHASDPVASGRKHETLTTPESGTSEALQSLETAMSQDADPSHEQGGGVVDQTGAKEPPVATDAGTENSEAPATPKAVQEAGEVVQSVLAPPDEVDHEGSDDDSFLSMFKGGDDEESTVGDLADRLEDVDASSLLSAAMETVATMKGKGGGDA